MRALGVLLGAVPIAGCLALGDPTVGTPTREDASVPRAVDGGAEPADATPMDAGARPADAATPDLGLAGDIDAGAPSDAGVPPPDAGAPDGAPLVVALGHGDRTMVSCDFGDTWVANRFELGAADDWGHHALTARALVAQGGWFFAAQGWGAPKRVRRSRDGVAWEDAIPSGDATDHWSGVATPTAVLFGQANRGSRTSDRGETWAAMSPPGHGKGLYAYGDGVVVLVSLGNERLVARSLDDGASWTSTRLDGDLVPCSDRGVAPAYHPGLFVFGSRSGATCVSTDLGATWTRGADLESGARQFVSTPAGLRAYTDDGAYLSPDGRAWTREGDTQRLSEILRLPTGRYVALSDAHVHVSEDGITWQPAPHPEDGPPLVRLAFGYGQAPAACTP